MSEVTKAILLDDTGKEIKEALGVIAEAIKNQQGGGSSLAWVQDVQDGEKIATITINGTPTEVYVPKRYEKPETGIPESDLATDVTQKLENLDSDGEIDYSHVKNTPNLDLKADKSTTYTKTEVDNKVDSTASTAYVKSDGKTVEFDGIDINKCYRLVVNIGSNFSAKSPVGIESIAQQGTKLTYVLSNASINMECKLREIKL